MGVLPLGCCPPGPPPTSPGVLACLLVAPAPTVLGDTVDVATVCMDVPPKSFHPARAVEKCKLFVRTIYTRIYSRYCFPNWKDDSLRVMRLFFFYSFHFLLQLSCQWAKPSSLTCLMSLIVQSHYLLSLRLRLFVHIFQSKTG